MKENNTIPEPLQIPNDIPTKFQTEPKKPLPKFRLIILAILVLVIISLPLGAYLMLRAFGIHPKSSTVTIKSTSPTPTPTIISLQPLTASESSTWKTYVNNKYGFSIEYPDGYKFSDFGSHNNFLDNLCLVYLQSEGGCFMNIGIYNEQIDKHISELNGGKNYSLEIYNYHDGKIVLYRTLHNNPVIHYNEVSFVSYFVQKTNYLFELSSNGWDSPYYETASYSAIFSTMLSTLKFTDQTSKSSGAANPTPTCIPRPACLDATPRCMIAESKDMCPPTTTPSP